MKKIDCLADYFLSTKAIYTYLMGMFYNDNEWKEYILSDKKYLLGAKVSFAANIMFGIKEDIILKKDGFQYESKLFLDSLESVVSFLADKVDDGYKLGNYVFPDAPTVVSIIRNKLAHGNYVIDFDNEKIITNHKGIDIEIEVSKLINFILVAFLSYQRQRVRSEYKHDVGVFKIKDINRDARISTYSEIRNIIKNFHIVTFRICSNEKDSYIGKDCIDYLEKFINLYRLNPDTAIQSELYKYLRWYLSSRNCYLDISSRRIKDRDTIFNIGNLVNEDVIKNKDLGYKEQVHVIGSEVQRVINSDYNTFNPLAANINNIILVDAIEKCNSVDKNIVDDYLLSRNYGTIKIGYDELGASLISMFNASFLYPYDSEYTSSGGYKIDRDGELDFSLLDLSMVNPLYIEINKEPLNNSKDRYDALLNKRNELDNRLVICQNNLINVSSKGNINAVNKINLIINDINSNISNLDLLLKDAKNEYDEILKDYTDNYDYFYKKAIIEGIRNSIAHGRYEIISSEDIMDTKILFNDIYNGKITFKLEISFYDFITLIENNFKIIMDEKMEIKKKILGM